jgi:hypothetical protein
MAESVFHRTFLAKNIANRVLSSKGMSGVFISGPRRTGKSTLIKEDIIPYLREQGAEVIYVDLWEQRDRDPGELISDAVRDHLQQREGALLKWARKGGMDTVTVAGIKMDIAKVGLGTKSFAKALADLSDATKAMIVLVIDEAQHATTSDAGASALFSLKAARDLLNGSDHHGFRLIATGSNRDKLNLLVHGKDQAFMGAPLFDLEPLGADYLQWELEKYDGEIKPSIEVLFKSFVESGNKPEAIRKSLDDLAFRFDVTKDNINQIFLEGVQKVMSNSRQEFIRQVIALPPLQAAVLTVMAKMDSSFAPFRGPTVEMYTEEFKKISTSKTAINDSSIQFALEALRAKTLVWKSARGVYAIEDSQHAAWLSEPCPEIDQTAAKQAKKRIRPR